MHFCHFDFPWISFKSKMSLKILSLLMTPSCHDEEITVSRVSNATSLGELTVLGTKCNHIFSTKKNLNAEYPKLRQLCPEECWSRDSLGKMTQYLQRHVHSQLAIFVFVTSMSSCIVWNGVCFVSFQFPKANINLWDPQLYYFRY